MGTYTLTLVRQVKISIVFFMACMLLLLQGSVSHAGETVRLEMWSHWGNEPMKVRFIEETIAAFEQQHPDIAITLRWIPKNRIYQTIQGLLPKRLGPDIFYGDPYPVYLGEWVKQGYLLNLRDELDWNRFVTDSYRPLQYPDGGIYGVPVELAEYAIYYNKELFAKADITIPVSGKFAAEAFLNAVKTFRAYHIIPVAVGNQDRGIASNMLFQGLLLRFAGVEKLTGLASGETAWDDADIVAAFRYMKQLIDANIFPEKMNLLKYHEGRQLFVEGKAAMYVEGTWFFGKIADENGELPDYLAERLGAMDYPTVPHGRGNSAIERMTGGCYLIRSSSSYRQEAIRFLDFLTSPTNGLRWIRYTQSPFAVRAGFREHVAQPFLQELFRSRKDATEFLTPGIGALLSQKEFQSWTRDVGIAFMGGSISVDEAIQRLIQAER